MPVGDGSVDFLFAFRDSLERERLTSAKDEGEDEDDEEPDEVLESTEFGDAVIAIETRDGLHSRIHGGV
jgi:hypothetical protein